MSEVQGPVWNPVTQAREGSSVSRAPCPLPAPPKTHEEAAIIWGLELSPEEQVTGRGGGILEPEMSVVVHDPAQRAGQGKGEARGLQGCIHSLWK